MHIRNLTTALVALTAATGLGGACQAQTVQPLIAEYTDHAAGSFEVTNSSLVPAIMQLEPKSFAIAADGTGEFRDLDANIHLELSATSLRLDPHQTAHVFYKVTAEHAPAWLSIYATFSAVKRSSGLNVRMMLPHTIYVYHHQPLERAALDLTTAHYDAATHKVICELTNTSERAGRLFSHDHSYPTYRECQSREQRNQLLSWRHSADELLKL